ncbi:hypothetical protein [Streptomyces sp. NPDC001536]|uniref:hypothetical protein n=1 Tax=Streptomyces sp. NPDC001536 TaxID=3364583 RepID=UPI0036A3566A
MGKPNTRRQDREILLVQRKIEAVRRQEWWPLTGSERRQIMTALAGGSLKVARGKSPARAERKLDAVTQSVMKRLASELSALENERQRIVNAATAAKAARKSSGWW